MVMKLETNQTPLELPLLDLSQPLLPCTLSTIAKGCEEWGFLHITNHGIPRDLFERIQAHVDQVFSLPLDTKLKLGPSCCADIYTPPFIVSPYYETLRVSGPNFYDSAKRSSDVLFGTSNTDFCDVLEEYGKKMMELSRKVIAVLLECLGQGIKRKYNRAEFGRCHGYLRINHYNPPTEIGKEDIEGLGNHTDMSCITILHQSKIGGLQMRSKQGEWVDVLPKADTLIINIGDLLQAWSNGRLRSSEHRVVLRQSAVDRLSLAFFWLFEDDKIVFAPEEVVGPEEERIYRPFLCGDYLKYREFSEEGSFDKVGYTIDNFTS